MSYLYSIKTTYALAAMLGLSAMLSPAFAQIAPAPEAPDAPASAQPMPTPASASDEMRSAPEAPSKPSGPVYNPPPPSGKDWGKLPQESREQILNEWKALPEKDREPFIFYRERAMAKLPDSAYSDNPYKPDAPVAPDAAAVKGATAPTAPTPPSAASPAVTEDKATGGSFFDKLMGKDDADKSE